MKRSIIAETLFFLVEKLLLTVPLVNVFPRPRHALLALISLDNINSKKKRPSRPSEESVRKL